jgi:RNA polymerase sigma-70 factor (ECF subfamily)
MALVQTEDAERRKWLAIEFERHRTHLRAVGYRMLGSMAEADDAVQEAWIRLQRRDPGDTNDLRGWLTVTVGRICLDMLRSRSSRRETYAGTWLPEPLVTWPGADGRAQSNPETAAVMADSVGIALLVVLEALTPPERLAFVLHDVFGVGFDEIAAVVDRTPAAARQLASRARRRVRAEAPEPDADLAVQRQVVDAFVAAARAGEFEALLRVLDPDVVVTTDGGGRGPFARPPLRGAEAVAHRAGRFGARFASYARPAIVNGQAGIVVDGAPRQPRIIASFRLREGRIAAIQFNADPDKTQRVGG